MVRAPRLPRAAALAPAAALALAAWCPAVSAAPSPDVGDLVVIDGGAAQVSLYGLLQTQLALYAGSDNIFQDGDPAEQIGARIRRARLGFKGWAWGVVDFEIATQATSEGVDLLEAWVGYRNFSIAGFTLGAHMVPFSRFAMMSASAQAISERPLASSAMAPFRQVGLTLEGDLGGLARYAVGAYNGFERNTNFHEGYVENGALEGNRFNRLAFAGRLELEPLGSLGDDMADLDGGGLRVGVGTALYFNDGKTTKTTGWEADLHLKIAGFHLAFEYLADSAEPKDEPTTTATIPASVDRFAVVGEAGYMLMPGQLGLTARAELVDDNRDLDDNGDEVVVAGGLAWYWHRQHLKATLDYTHRLERHGATRDNGTLLLQLQLAL